MKDITTEEGKHEFAAALAARQKELKEKCAWAFSCFTQLNLTSLSLEGFKGVCKLNEKAYLKWKQHAEAIVDLPQDIKQAFDEEYERISI